MRLFVVIGYPDAKPTAQPFPVYVGTSGAEKLHAMNRSTAERFLILDNPVGIPKHNKLAAANRRLALETASLAELAAKPPRRR